MAFLANWFTIGIILIILEMLLPGIFLMWFGISALLVGFITLFFAISTNTSLVLFAVLSLIVVVAVIIVMRRVVPDTQSTTTQNLNQARGTEFIGMTFTLDSKVINNEGKLNIGDTVWYIRGPDADAGTQVIITGIENNTLTFNVIN